MKVQVLGPGCAKCKKTYDVVVDALRQLGENADVEKIDRIDEIMKFGVMMTPAVVVNGKVKCSGKIPTVAEVTNYIATALAEAE
jgi:small redox-active disulfide protein 2